MLFEKRTGGFWKASRTHLASHDTWYVITDANGGGPIIEVGGKDLPGQVAEAKYLITNPEEIKANADLIAAAPKLLELLYRACLQLKQINGPDENCVIGDPWRTCKNHALIHEIEDAIGNV